MARYIAKHIVASGLADRCNVEMVYVLGLEYPVSFNINTFEKNNEKLNEVVKNIFDLSPMGIIETLDLRRPVYKLTSSYGHFGKEDEDITWEILNEKIIERLKSYG